MPFEFKKWKWTCKNWTKKEWILPMKWRDTWTIELINLKANKILLQNLKWKLFLPYRITLKIKFKKSSINLNNNIFRKEVKIYKFLLKFKSLKLSQPMLQQLLLLMQQACLNRQPLMLQACLQLLLLTHPKACLLVPLTSHNLTNLSHNLTPINHNLTLINRMVYPYNTEPCLCKTPTNILDLQIPQLLDH